MMQCERLGPEILKKGTAFKVLSAAAGKRSSEMFFI